jgi:hypothetical protein
MKKINIYYVVFAVIALLFITRYGIEVLIPTSDNWLMSAYGDWGQHHLGWIYYKEADWQFPLGKIDNYNYPAGTTVGYTDSIPLVSIFLKLFSFILPDNFQYLGLWLLISIVLTGYFAIKIIKLYTNNTILIIASSLLIAFNPVILYRDMHPALTAHWLIIGSIYYYLMLDKNNFKETLKNQGILNMLAALINPYLLIFSLLISFTTLIKGYIFKIFSIKKSIIYTVITLTTVLLLWVLTGMITFDDKVNMEVSNSYGLYSLNLNSFYNSDSFSKFLPSLPRISPQQYEGYSYFGAGILILIALSIILFVFYFKQFKPGFKKLFPLLITSILFFLFALTNKVVLNDKVVLEYYLPETIMKLGGVFRASGRFVWLIYYVIIITSIIVVIKSKLKVAFQILILSFLLLFQLYDESSLFNKTIPAGRYKNEKISEEKWVKLTSNFKKIITYEPFNNHLSQPMDYQDLCYMALKNNLPITIGYVARESTEINNKFKDSLNLQIKENTFSDKDIYIVSPKNIGVFKSAIYQNKLEIIKLDSYYVLYSKGKKLNCKIDQTLKDLEEVASIKKSIAKEFSFKKISKPISDEGKFNFNIEEVFHLNNQLQIDGWGFLKQSNHTNDSVFIAIVNDKNSYLLNTEIKQREDLVGSFNDKSLMKSGFSCKNITSEFVPGRYEIYLAIKSGNNFSYVNTNKNSITINKENKINVLKTLPATSEDIIFNIEKTSTNSNNYIIEGWAGLKNENSDKNIINVLLISSEKYLLDVNYFKRPDVTTSFKITNNKNYDDSGFKAIFKKQNIKTGVYKIAIVITDVNGSKKMIFTEKKITIK